MKKLILTVAVVIGGLVTMNAQETKQLKAQTSKDKVKTEMLEKKETLKNQKSLRSSAEVKSDKASKRNFESIANNEIPSAVEKQVKQNYNNATISKASVNSKGVYRLEVLDENNSKKVVYITKDGERMSKSLKGQK